MSTHNTEVILMSTNNIGFCEEMKKNYLSIILIHHQMHTLSVLFIPPANFVCGRVYCFHVCLSDRTNDRLFVRNVLFP